MEEDIDFGQQRYRVSRAEQAKGEQEWLFCRSIAQWELMAISSSLWLACGSCTPRL